MRQNNDSNRLTVIESQSQKKKRPPQKKTVVRAKQNPDVALHQAMTLANKREPTIQERAEKHRIENEHKYKQETHGQSVNNQRPKKKEPNQRTAAPKKSSSKSKKSAIKSKLFHKDKDIQDGPDFFIVYVVTILVVIGLVMVFSASSYRSLIEYGTAYSYFLRQFVYAIIGLGVMAVVAVISPDIFNKIAPIALFGVLLLVIYTIFNGEESLGATRWVTIGGIRFTPSEFAKPLMVICTADLIKNDPYDIFRGKNNIAVFAMMIVAVIAIASEDLGSAIAIVGGCFFIFCIAGITKRDVVIVMIAGILCVVAACIQEPYRIHRILGFLSQTEADAASGSAYQLVQSLYAFGSGGLFGVGIGNSGQKLLYLPGMHTDFIFSVIGEELGIIGALLVVALFMIFMWRGFWIAAHIEDTYKSYLAFGCTAIISVQALINMGVAVGLLPVTGITLPFISYGGTSLVMSLLIVGILLNMSRYADKGGKKKRVRRTKK